jgi:hypothetical protein
MSFPKIRATWLKGLNLWLAVLWMALIVPTVLFWSESVLFVAAASVYANVAGHIAAWQASRAEEMADPEVDTSTNGTA